jgi:hypothetical protein
MKRFSTAGVLALFYKDSSLGQLSRNGRTFQVGKLWFQKISSSQVSHIILIMQKHDVFVPCV